MTTLLKRITAMLPHGQDQREHDIAELMASLASEGWTHVPDVHSSTLPWGAYRREVLNVRSTPKGGGQSHACDSSSDLAFQYVICTLGPLLPQGDHQPGYLGSLVTEHRGLPCFTRDGYVGLIGTDYKDMRSGLVHHMLSAWTPEDWVEALGRRHVRVHIQVGRMRNNEHKLESTQSMGSRSIGA